MLGSTGRAPECFGGGGLGRSCPLAPRRQLLGNGQHCLPDRGVRRLAACAAWLSGEAALQDARAVPGPMAPCARRRSGLAPTASRYRAIANFALTRPVGTDWDQEQRQARRVRDLMRPRSFERALRVWDQVVARDDRDDANSADTGHRADDRRPGERGHRRSAGWGRLDSLATGDPIAGPAGWLNWCMGDRGRCAPADGPQPGGHGGTARPAGECAGRGQ